MAYENIPTKERNSVPSSVTKVLNITLDEVIEKVAVQSKHGYAKQTMSFEQATIGKAGKIPTYSIDSAHAGGLPVRTSDGFIVRLGAKGRTALAEFMSNIAVNEPEPALNEGN